MNPFDFVKSINETKEDIMIDDITEKIYAPFVINRTLSYHLDTVLQANEMNRLHHLGKKSQYVFLLNTVRKRKRWGGKWHKQTVSDNIQLVCDYYGYSQAKAEAVLPLLSEEALDEMKRSLDPGGVVSTSKNKKK
jgi:hypothetical protein